jgi:hypothetical protein
MSIFREIAESIANVERFSEKYPFPHGSDEKIDRMPGGVSIHDFPGIISHDKINCYPSALSSPCYDKAVFISLNGKIKGNTRNHLSFDQALREIVHHMDTRCESVTKEIGLITDAWDAKSFDEWRPHLRNYKRSGIMIEAYLIAQGMVTKIDLAWL